MHLHGFTLEKTFFTHFPAVFFVSKAARSFCVWFDTDDFCLFSSPCMLSYVDLHNTTRLFAECSWTKGSVSVCSRRFLEEHICEMFRTAMLEIGQSSILEQLVVVKEPLLNHYGFQFRVIFKTKTCFASDDINTLLAQKRGCRGSMSRPEKNWQSLVQYVLDCKTKRKEVAEDKIPLFWPHMWQTKSQVLQQWQSGASAMAGSSNVA